MDMNTKIGHKAKQMLQIGYGMYSYICCLPTCTVGSSVIPNEGVNAI